MSRKTWRTSAAEADRSHKTFCKALTGELATAKKIINAKALREKIGGVK